MSDDNRMVRGVWGAIFWVVFMAVTLPALYLLDYLTRLVAWIDSLTAYPIGRLWGRFLEWYFGLFIELGDIPDAIPDEPNHD